MLVRALVYRLVAAVEGGFEDGDAPSEHYGRAVDTRPVTGSTRPTSSVGPTMLADADDGPRPTVPAAPILVVDDDAKIVRLVRTYLERDGFTVVTAADGPAALEAIETHRPALVVLDLMLPELDGRAVIRAVRRDEEAARTPILVLSARSSTIDRIAGLEDGADDYLPKPFSPAELVLRVKSILRRAAPTADAAPTRRVPRSGRPGHPPRRPDDRPVAPRGPPRRRQAIDLTRVEFRLLSADPRGRRPGPVARPAARRGLRPGRGRRPRSHDRRPHPPAARQARRRSRRAALRADRPRRRVPGRRGRDRARASPVGSRWPPSRRRRSGS